ncbi:hypothetical protein QLH32_05545 [Acinetobacter corruptisaponis]|uniref:Phage protein n=1 Tax=Acinetobacter corruptisaponis TaxID=3045147 RepID=A0ABY8S6A7_9GAMM|nr:hypothetical protein [Acinetobacter sp. KCTC 92772]WHP06931.1 hypothetical protein QLH32_05545 [Acinetobacter sp. KCTC 92772]
MAALPAIAAVASVASTAISAYSMYQNNKTQGEQAEADADAARSQGRLEAERIRSQKEKTQSAARAALAQNGLDVGEGTAVTINDRIERDAEYDAAMSEIAGFNASQRLQAEASVHRKNANTAAITGALDTMSKVGDGYVKYKNGWK